MMGRFAAGVHRNEKTSSWRRWDMDALKAVGCLFVVLYHAGVNSTFLPFSSGLCYYIGSLFSAGVPLFLSVSGYLYARAEPQLEKRWKKAAHLIALTAVWGLITTVALQAERGQVLTLGEFVRHSVGFEQGVTNHLWFLASMAGVLMVLPLLLVAKSADERLFTKVAWGGVLALFGTDLLTRLARVFGWVTGIDATLVLAQFLVEFSPLQGTAGFVIAYVLLGMVLGSKDKLCLGRRTSAAIVVLAPAVLALYAFFVVRSGTADAYDPVWFGYPFVGTAGIVVALYSLCAGRVGQSALGSLVGFVGRNSMAVYLLHPLAIYTLSDAVRASIGVWWGRALVQVALCLATILIAACIGEIARRWRFSRWLFSA